MPVLFTVKGKTNKNNFTVFSGQTSPFHFHFEKTYEKHFQSNILFSLIHNYISHLCKTVGIRRMPVLGWHLQGEINPFTFESCPPGMDIFIRDILWEKKQGGTFISTVHYLPCSCKSENDKAVRWKYHIVALPLPIKFLPQYSLTPNKTFLCGIKRKLCKDPTDWKLFCLLESHLILLHRKKSIIILIKVLKNGDTLRMIRECLCVHWF